MKNQAISRPCPPQKGRKSAAEHGSVIFIILIAIALFAALSFVIMQSSRTGAGTLTDQQAKLAATSVITYLNGIREAVNSLIIKGCDPLKIDFGTPVFTRKNGTQIDTTPPGAQAGCELFSPTGANAKAVILRDAMDKSYVPPAASDGNAMTFAARYADTGLGSSANDLIYRSTGANMQVCLQLLNMIKKSDAPDYTSVATAYYPTAGLNSWTNTGNLNPDVTIPAGSRIFAMKLFVADTQCSIGIVLKAF